MRSYDPHSVLAHAATIRPTTLNDAMDGLLTMSSPRAAQAEPATFSHKAPARSRRNGKPSPRTSNVVSPRPPPSRPNPRTASNNNAHDASSSPRGRAASAIESFRSVAVLEEVVRVENIHSRSSLGPEEAFQLLQRLVPQTQCDVMQGLSHQHLLDGLEAACWRRFSPGAAHDKSTHSDSSMRLAVPYTQLYNGMLESIREKETAIETLENVIRETVQHTNELPRRIKAHEQEIATTIASFVSLSAASLDCAVQRNRRDFGKNLIKSRVDTHRLAAQVRERIATLRRRKDLRMWACDQLRGQINDHMTRASELKKEITLVLGDVKKEELAHKVKTKRMEEAITGMTFSPSGRKNSMSGVVATKMLVGGGFAAITTAAKLSHPGTAVPPVIPLSERLALAHDTRHELEAAIALKREHVRKRTEEIFDVRNEAKSLQATIADFERQTDALEEEMNHIQRACTPRPNWEELQRAVAVTTAIDHLGRNVRASLQSRDRRGLRGGGELDDDDEASMSRKLQTILASTWATVDKVEALAQELCRIRDKYHGGEEITAERAKLALLQKEIQQTLEQLATLRSLASRGTGAS